MSTEATLAHHLGAFSEGIEAIMRDFTAESVVFTPDGPLHGLEEIRGLFDGFLRTSPPELLQAMKVIRQDVDGHVAYLLWKAEPFIPFAADTFVIHDDKIIVQSFAMFPPVAAPSAGESSTVAVEAV